MIDVPITVAVGLVMTVGTAHLGRPTLAPMAYALVWIAAAGLLVRRRAPMASLVIGTAAAASYLALGYPPGPIFAAVAWPIAMVARRTLLLRSVVCCGASVLVIAAAELIGQSASLTDLLVLGWLLVPWAVGTVSHYRGEAFARIGDEIAVRREFEESRATYEERLRIARDVHDVVGHALAVINMQAGVALHVVGKQPQQAELALAAIKRTSKDALDDLRSTLDVYRQEPGAPRRPTPGIGQLATLIAESGVDAHLTVTGDDREFPAAVDVTAYRIVQESLTNVLRHAGPARADVLVDRRPGELLIEVTDDGRGPPDDETPGHGLAGMRERVAAVRGSLEAGARPEGGFRVRARIPLGVVR
jgi:signal transduction histidine kinase